jgi:hypothetical protein
MLNAAIQKTVRNSLSALQGFFVDATYKVAIGKSDINYTAYYDYQNTAVRCIVGSYSQREVREGIEVLQTDKKVIIPRRGLEIEISSFGELVISGVSHSIVTVQTDPAGALYVVQARTA